MKKQQLRYNVLNFALIFAFTLIIGSFVLSFVPDNTAQATDTYQDTFQYDQNGKIKGCATYQRKNGSWSKNYKVRGVILTGHQIQQEIHDDRFDVDLYSQYFLIRWKNGGYSALDIGSAGRPFIADRLIRDQIGKTWKLSSGWESCHNGYFDKRY